LSFACSIFSSNRRVADAVPYFFADFILDTDRRELRCRAAPVAVEPQVFDLLTYLIQNRGRVVSKDDLLEAVWSGRIVSESTIASRINAARKALGDSGQAQTLIRTVPRKGVRFVGDVRTEAEDSDPARAAGPTSTGVREPSPGAARPPARPDLRGAQFCMTSDGARIAFARVGNGPPLVWAAHWLSHLAFTWEGPVWRHWLEEFAKDHDFIRYDERGYGLSDWNDSEFSVDTFVRDLEAVVDALRLDRFALIGSGRGGPTAIAYAARHPDRVSRLVLVNAFAQGWRARGNAREIEQREAMITLMQQSWTQDNPISRQLHASLQLPDATSEETAWFNDLQRIAASADNAARLLRSVGDIDVRDILQDVAAPTLVLHCRDDALMPFRQGELVASGIPGARLVPLESRNHILMPRDPAWATFIDKMRRFLAEDVPTVQERGGAVSAYEPIVNGVHIAARGFGGQTPARSLGARTVSDDGEPARATEPAPNGSPAPSRLAALPPLDRPAIAVLPFLNMSGDLEQDYFSDGISEDIITALSRLRWFFVIARNSSFSYKGKSVHLKQIAAELGVGYVIEGSVRKSGDCMRITAQLSDVATGGQIWAERYDRRLCDVFAVQDEITDAVVAAIEPQIYAAEHFRSARKPPESLAAWELVMRAMSYFWRVTRDDNAAAQKLLARAIALIPDYAQANAVLAVSHTFGAYMGWEDGMSATPIAERAALAAIRADAEDPWAHLALANTAAYLGRLDDALTAFEQALRLNPNFSLALGSYGLVLAWVGRLKEGGDAARRALLLSPRDPFAAIYNGVIAYNAFVVRNYDEAMRAARESIRQRSDFAGGLRVFIAAAAMKGEIDVAKAALKDLQRVHPDVSLDWLGSQPPYAPASDASERFREAFRRAGLE
jgi:TolB-like protein/DNA-binding winged helix-turn-helix (wHTH) protein/pimeloyl-ACP methyl ester carboxylesterase